MTAKRKAKAHALLAKQSVIRSNEPQLSTENYNLSIGQILQWYTEHSTEKQRRKYALEHFAKQKGIKEVFAISKATDSEIRILAILCRLIDREQPLSDDHTFRKVCCVRSSASSLLPQRRLKYAKMSA